MLNLIAVCFAMNDRVDVAIYEIPATETRRITAWRTSRFRGISHSGRPRHWRVALTAMTIVGLMHALVIGPLLMGKSAPPPQRFDEASVGASVADSNQVPLLTVIFLQDEVSTSTPGAPVSDLSFPSPARADHPVRVLSPDDRPARDAGTIQAASDNPAGDPDDARERARLLGRYLGQIQARVIRAWIRPRTPIGEDEFRCRSKIRQDRDGNVLEIELQACNGDTRWQTSLAMAIQTASPLPAPPDPSVFVDVLTLMFEAQPYGSNENPQDYEPELPARPVLAFESATAPVTVLSALAASSESVDTRPPALSSEVPSP